MDLQRILSDLKAQRDRIARAIVALTGIGSASRSGKAKAIGRPKGSKAKTDWRLTNEGQTALEKHSHASADREVGRNPPRLVVGEQLGTANGGV